MYTFLYSLYFHFKRVQRDSRDKSVRNRIATKLIGYIEAYYNLYVVKKWQKHPLKSVGVTSRKRKQKIIVSLTSYPKRISTVWIVIESLLQQTMKPDEIILWLAKEQFPSMESVPKELQRQQKRGLTIRFCKDLRSHKKYFYAMQEYPEDLIILVDDDTFYTKDLVAELYRLHVKEPQEIVCMTPAMIPSDFGAKPSSWRKAGSHEKIIHSYLAQPYTGQGTLYPPHSVSELAFDEEKVMKYCPYADDLWLKFFSLANCTRTTVLYPLRAIPVTIYGTGASSLWYINGPDGGKNDEQWKEMIKRYPDTFSEIRRLPLR